MAFYAVAVSADVDGQRYFGCMDAVFEYVLNECDEQQGGNSHVLSAIAVDVKPDIEFDSGVKSEPHEADIVRDKVKFLLY